MSRTHLATITLLLGLACPGVARADDLSWLVWVVVVWPLGIVFGLVLVVLAIVTAAKMRSGRIGRGRLGVGLAITAIVLDFVFCAVALGAGESTEIGFAAAHVLAAQVVSVPCLLLGLRARRQALRAAAR